MQFCIVKQNNPHFWTRVCNVSARLPNIGLSSDTCEEHKKAVITLKMRPCCSVTARPWRTYEIWYIDLHIYCIKVDLKLTICISCCALFPPPFPAVCLTVSSCGNSEERGFKLMYYLKYDKVGLNTLLLFRYFCCVCGQTYLKYSHLSVFCLKPLSSVIYETTLKVKL